MNIFIIIGIIIASIIVLLFLAAIAGAFALLAIAINNLAELEEYKIA